MRSKILVFDDQLGALPPLRSSGRPGFCYNCKLHDVSTSIPDNYKPRRFDNPTAEVVFHSGQKVQGDYIENDIEGSVRFALDGWKSENYWSLVLLDMHFKTGKILENGEVEGRDSDWEPDNYFGLKLLGALKEAAPDMPIVILSSMKEGVISYNITKSGALDFIDKQDMHSPDRLIKAIQEFGLIQDDRELPESEEHLRIHGKSKALLKSLRSARQAASSGTKNILITGETGVGKELLARYIHDSSPKTSGPYEVLFTQGVTDDLLASALFGHEKGSFTGADSRRMGMLAKANDGSLFIDEVGDLSLPAQTKLLRFLDTDNRKFQRLGSDSFEKSDAQIIAATNKELDGLIEEGLFKSDLEARFNFHIEVPPLRRRKDDIPLLANLFLERAIASSDATEREITEQAEAKLKAYDWPQNVRELRHAIELTIQSNKRSKFLIPEHLQLRNLEKTEASGETASQLEQHPSQPPALAAAPETIEDLISTLERFEVESSRQNLEGKLMNLRVAVARMFANVFKAAFYCPSIPKDHIDKDPEEWINVSGAANLLAGSKMKTSQAYSLLIKLLTVDKLDATEVHDSSEILAALRAAINNRR